MSIKDLFKPKEVRVKERDKEVFEKSERFHEIFTELTKRHNKAVTLKQYDRLRKLVATYSHFDLFFVRKINNSVALRDLETERIIDIFETKLRHK